MIYESNWVEEESKRETWGITTDINVWIDTVSKIELEFIPDKNVSKALIPIIKKSSVKYFMYQPTGLLDGDTIFAKSIKMDITDNWQEDLVELLNGMDVLYMILYVPTNMNQMIDYTTMEVTDNVVLSNDYIIVRGAPKG